MADDFSEQLDVDLQKIKDAVRLQLPLEITSYTLPRNMELYIRKVLELFLKECCQEHMYEYLNFCLGELLTNSKKANTKRVYFKEKGLDINNHDDYEKGMEHFKDDTLTNIGHYLELQKKEGLYIKLGLQIKGEQIHVEIKNNSKITLFEQERINNKINAVQAYKNMEEVFTNVLDQSEGAGLGIIIIILMLQKIGLSKENYQVIATDTETITKIILPCNQKVFAGNEILSYEFVKMQSALPVLDSNHKKLIQLLSQSPINRQEVLSLIQSDITLSMLLLKTNIKYNSKEIEIKKALENFSDSQLLELYSSGSSEFSLLNNSEENLKLWTHSKNVAFYAYNLVKNIPDLQDVISAEQAYTLGLINQIGLIMLKNASEEQLSYVKELSDQYDEKDKILDLFFSGNSSPRIAMIYSKKIGIPDSFTAIIGFWNNCEYIPANVKTATYIIYIAELLEFYSEGLVEFYQIDKSILKLFNITTETQFKHILTELSKN